MESEVNTIDEQMRSLVGPVLVNIEIVPSYLLERLKASIEAELYTRDQYHAGDEYGK